MAETHSEPTFEELLRDFDDAVTSLESDSLSLESALERYETAVHLAERCARILRTAELRISEIEETLENIGTTTPEE